MYEEFDWIQRVIVTLGLL